MNKKQSKYKIINLGKEAKLKQHLDEEKSALIVKVAEDTKLGVSISYIHNQNNSGESNNNSLITNLDETLKRVTGENEEECYIYTDVFGNSHRFKETLYEIDSNGKRVDLSIENKSYVESDANGRLWLNGEEVFRELKTNNGLIATSSISGIKYEELLDTRIDEEKQLEEQLTYYENLLEQFLIFNAKPFECRKYDDEIKDYESFMPNEDNGEFLLYENEYQSYISLDTQFKSQELSIKNINNQFEICKTSGKSCILDKTCRDWTCQKCDYNDKSNCASKNDEVYSETISNQNEQKDLLDKQKKQLSALNGDIKKRMEEILKRSIANYEDFVKYYREYYNLKKSLELLKKHIPKAYIYFDNVTRGYNEDGDLVVIYKKSGEYVAIEREEYKDAYRITTLFDKDGNSVTFDYDENNKLCKIITSTGEKIDISYNINFFKRNSIKGQITCEYDDYGRLCKYFDSGSKGIEFSYDVEKKEMKIIERFKRTNCITSETVLLYSEDTTTITSNGQYKDIYFWKELELEDGSKVKEVGTYGQIISNTCIMAKKI